MIGIGNCPLSFQLDVQILNSAVLIIVLLVQGTILDYYIIHHNDWNFGWYFLFLFDLLVLVFFLTYNVTTYRFYQKKAHFLDAGMLPTIGDKPPPIPRPPKFGYLPLTYCVWLFYIASMVVKILILFKLNIAQSLQKTYVFGPQFLTVTIGMCSIVFFLLVESHHDAHPEPERLAYMHILITTTAFDLFDSITFLAVLFPSNPPINLPNYLENVILALACANFFLPGLALFKLSRNDFAVKHRSIRLNLIYKMVHLCMINIPFLVVRIYLWCIYRQDISIFLMKNVLGIVVLILTAIPDIRFLKKTKREKMLRKKFEENAVQLSVIGDNDLPQNGSDGGILIRNFNARFHTQV